MFVSKIYKLIIASIILSHTLAAFAEVDDFKTFDDIKTQYETRESKRNAVMTGLSMAASATVAGIGIAASYGSFGTLMPWTIPIVSVGITGVAGGLNELTKISSFQNINEQYNSFIYKVYKDDSQSFSTILAEHDDAKRAKMVFDKISQLDSYKDLIPSDSAKRSIYNSAAIIKIIEVTKALGKENIQQNEAIKELKADYESLSKKMENPESKKQVVSFTDKVLEASKSLVATTEGAKRAIASIDQAEITDITDQDHPAVLTPKDKNFKEKYEVFHSALEQTAYYYGSAYQIAVNLGLHGKDQERMAKGMMYLNTAVSVSKAVVANDPQSYMAAAVSVTALFGKKADTVDPKQQEIMAAFGKMFEMQTLILKNQQEIYNLQIKNYDLLVSLYEFNQKEFIKLGDGLDLILGGQAVLQQEVKDYSNLSPKLESCDSFLNSRIDCPPSDFGDLETLPNCLKRSLKTDFEVPAQPVYYTGLYGQYKNLQSVEKHLKNNIDAYYSCQSGLGDLLLSTSTVLPHSAFLASNIVEGGKTGYQEVVARSYLPLVELAKIYYGKHENLTLLYLMLLSPSQSINQYNFKLTNAKRWFNSVEFDQERKLSQKTYQDVLENLIYVPNLEKYASIQLQMLNYTQYVPSKFDANSTLNPNFLKVGLANSTNETIRNRLLILEKLVNVAIAQQSLLSGEPFVGQVDYLLNPSNAGTVAQNAVLKLLRNNTFFRLNYLKLSLRNMLTYTVNRKPNLKYTEQLNANLKAYADYINSGYQNCEIKGQQKNPNCDEVIYSGLSDHFKIIGKKIIITDKDRGDFSIDLPNAEYLSTNNFEHTAELKRLYSLRALIDSYVFKSKDFYNRAIDENYYVH